MLGLWFEETFYAGDEFLWLERFADEFVGADGDSLVGDVLVDYTGHENDGRCAELRMLLDLAADGVAVLIGHDDIGDDGVGRSLLELRNGGSGVASGKRSAG